MKKIKLTKGVKTLVDDDIFDYFGNLRWHAFKDRSTWRVVRNLRVDKTSRKTIYLHHLIVGYPLRGNVVDHIDGNGLNNQRSNLRIVNTGFNRWNSKKRREGKVIGVYKDCSSNKWRAQVKRNKLHRYLGTFNTKREAIRAINNMDSIYVLHGVFESYEKEMGREKT